MLIFVILMLFGFTHAHEMELHNYIHYNVIHYPWIVKIHPPIVHFGVSIPLISLIIELYYLMFRRKVYPYDLFVVLSMINALTITLSVLSGYVIHKAISTIPIYVEAANILHTHQKIGFYLLFISYIWLLIKIVLLFRAYNLIRITSVVVLLFMCILVFYQGYLGGLMVYDYGISVNTINLEDNQ